MSAEQHQGWIPIARILRPQGRRGEVLCDLLTDLNPSEQFATGRSVSLAPPVAAAPAPASTVSIESYFLPTGKNAGRIVLKLGGCDSISAAELLAGQQVVVPAADLPTLDDDTFYVNDLLGCELFNGAGLAGVVVDVQFATSPDGKTRLADAAPLLCIALPGSAADAEPLLVPFVRAQLETVDLASKRIVMHLPDGLLDATTEAAE